MRRTANRAFTLIEILIVVVILGILAAIVIPQFSNASDEAALSSTQSQLQTLRGQIELFRVQDASTDVTRDYPDLLLNGWDEMTDPAQNNEGKRYLQQAPRNPLQDNSTSVAAAAAAGVGWVWDVSDPANPQLYAVDQDNTQLAW